MQYLSPRRDVSEIGPIIFPGRDPFAQHILSRSGTLLEPSKMHNF